MKTVTGNLIAMATAGEFDVIVHGCNCFHTMGAGIAAQIAYHFPAAKLIDDATAHGSYDKRGHISFALCGKLVVVNAYTQWQPGPFFDSDSLWTAMVHVRELFGGKRIGYPKIGAGIGGGDWEKIAGIIEETLAGEDHTLVVLP
jgi:O-acetyl-ADP-ribose deacetylase (regulator of RNase III)